MGKKVSVGIIGANGYTGLELVRLLINHPEVTISALTSRQHEGQKFEDVFAAFAGQDLPDFEKLDVKAIAKKTKAVFLCLPHHESMEVAASFRKHGLIVIDLSADFRLKEVSSYEKWYGPHTQKKLIAEAVYGLPELFRADIKKAKLIASPGCYPTSIALGLAPLLKNKMIDPKEIIADSKSGTSGAGRTAKTDILFGEVHENFKAYNVGVHRHTPEIEQTLSELAGDTAKVLFAPHLLPIDRGILSTIYTKPTRKWKTSEVLGVFKKFYAKEQFVTVLPEGKLPATKNVRGTNMCQIGVLFDERTEKIIVISAIDNLTKGASGQAVQAFNIVMGFDEASSLHLSAMIP